MDIFDERESAKSTREIVSRLHAWYDLYLTSKPYELDPDVYRRRSRLAMKFPEDELVRQIIIDVIEMSKTYNIDPKDIVW